VVCYIMSPKIEVIILSQKSFSGNLKKCRNSSTNKC